MYGSDDLKKNIYKIIFIIDLLFIIFIPTIAKVFIKEGSMLDYIIPYYSNIFTLTIVGILVAIYCIKNK